MSERAQGRAQGRGDLGGRGDGPFLLALSLAVLGVTGVDVFSVMDERARAGRPVPLWEPAVWEMSSAAVLIVLLPGLAALARRLPPWPLRAGRLLAHLIAFAVFFVAHTLGMGLLRAAVYRLAGGVYDPLAPLGNWGYELRKDALVYLSVVTLHVVWSKVRPAQALAPPAPPAPLEVRDGARRHVLDPARIDWVEAAGNYVELHGPDGPVLHRAPLSRMQAQLAGAGFVRIHRSRLVRLAAIRTVESTPSGDFTVVLADGTRLGGSRRYRVESLSPALDPAARSD